MRQIKKDSTNISVDIYIIDATDGTPETGVVFDTSGIDLEYRRAESTPVNIVEVDLITPALTDPHEDGGFLEIGHGYYRLDVPDAAFATGASTVSIQGTVTGMIVLPQTIQLVDNTEKDVYDRIGADGASLSDLGGMSTGMKGEVNAEADTALSNYGANTTVPDVAGTAPTALENRQEMDSNSTKLSSISTDAARLTAARAQVLDDWINAGRLDAILDIIAGDVVNINGAAMRGTDGANTTTPPTASQIQTEMEENGASLLDTIRDELANGTDGLSALKTLIDTVNTDLSNGTDGLGALKTLIDTVNTDLSNGTDGLGALKTLIAALNNISNANVLTQVNTALDTAITELAQAQPTATPTVRTGLMLLYMALRNKIDITATTKEVHNNAGTQIAKKTLNDDGTTYSETVMAAGT